MNASAAPCQIYKCKPEDLLDDRRVAVIVSYDGTIEAVEPEGSIIFGFPSKQLIVSK